MKVQTKSLLAKLLATENILVEHKKISTAYFDTKNRIMVLPIWKEMSSELYDLLLGHEVGHALFTPPEGWHQEVVEPNKKGFKSYLNVVEDSRIEKMIQERFPGLKPSFRKGYSELMQRDFFGIEKMAYDIEDLPLIDRINLHYKIGPLLNVHFESNEILFLDKIEDIRTWDDVVRVANELYEYGKTEESLIKFDDVDYNFSEDEDDFDTEWSPTDEENPNKKEEYETIRKPDNEKDFDPESLTDKFFRQMESQLIDDSVKPYVYVNCPTPNLEKIIIPYKRLEYFYDKFIYIDYSMDHDQRIAVAKIESEKSKELLYARFLKNNKKYISYLVKEFELKRNAKQFARASVAKTGKLDMKKIHQYKTNDDLFKRMTVVPKGKSHGLVMFVDYSGSMGQSIAATIEQTIILAMFCRKVNIPFRVYAFLDNRPGIDSYSKETGKIFKTEEDYYKDSYAPSDKFSSNPNELVLDNASFRLREYLSSEMSSNEFKNACKYWMLCGELNTIRHHYSRKDTQDLISQYLKAPDIETLNGTPLNDAVVSAIEITTQFRAQYKLDIVNTVFLTDGDSNESGLVYKENGAQFYDRNGGDCNVIVRHAKTMAEGKKVPSGELTVALLEILKQVSNVNSIGFFIAPYYGRGVIANRIQRSGKVVANFDNKMKLAKRNKFFMLNDVGYDDYYIIPGGKDLDITEDTMIVDANSKKSDIKNAFLKMQKGKSLNRVLLSRFIDKIA
jgi:hypothetical protein